MDPRDLAEVSFLFWCKGYTDAVNVAALDAKSLRDRLGTIKEQLALRLVVFEELLAGGGELGDTLGEPVGPGDAPPTGGDAGT